MALAEHPEDISRLTIKGNTVAVVTDGSAVLGLGNIGPGAALPVMEGKAALFKRFANIDAWPICLASQDTDEIVKAVEMIAPGFGGINLEDIAAPRCFEIEARLRASLDIPVFHDDQHGTAIVVMAALTNALRVVGKKMEDVHVVVAGAGAAGSAIVTLMLAAGITDIVVWDREGCLSSDDTELPLAKASLAARTNPRHVRGTLRDGLQQADVFVGVSAPNVLDPEWITEMATDAVVFALANPDPEVDPAEADKYAAVVDQRPQRLPEPDQQRAGVPGRLPRPAGRPRQGDHPRHAAPRRRRDRPRRHRRRDQPELHHPERLQPGGPHGGGFGDPRPGGRLDGVTNTLGNFFAIDIDGDQVELASYAGQVVLVVNTASQCGFTPQYAGLQRCTRRTAPRAWPCSAFPATSSANQEPGSEDEIAEFAESSFGVTFPMFAKVEVNGETRTRSGRGCAARRKAPAAPTSTGTSPSSSSAATARCSPGSGRSASRPTSRPTSRRRWPRRAGARSSPASAAHRAAPTMPALFCSVAGTISVSISISGQELLGLLADPAAHHDQVGRRTASRGCGSRSSAAWPTAP